MLEQSGLEGLGRGIGAMGSLGISRISAMRDLGNQLAAGPEQKTSGSGEVTTQCSRSLPSYRFPAGLFFLEH